MQAIITKYIGPTDYRGSRVKATCQAGSVTLNWDDALNSEQNHDAAALALVRKLEWNTIASVKKDSAMYRGGLPSGEGNCYVFPVKWARVELKGEK